MSEQPRDRSLFWPIVLIGAGVIWLLANFDLIQDLNLGLLLRLWPLFLIAAGLELLVGRGRPLVGALIGLLTVGAAVALLFYGPRLGLARSPEVKTERFSAPLEGASSGLIELDLSSYATEVQALGSGDLLFDGELTHRGEVFFGVSGSTQKTVSLDYSEQFTGPWDWFDGVDGPWTIGLSPDVPLDVSVDAGSGSTTLDLRGLELEGLSINGGSGSIRLNLAEGPEGTPYEARLEGGSGSIVVTLAEGTNASLLYDGGSGSLTVDVPAGVAAQVDVRESGSGSVRVPGAWEEVRSADDDEGTWQTADFEAATRQFTLIVENLGSGSVTVR
jgi:hypothetical protein